MKTRTLKELSIGTRFRFVGEEQVHVVYDLDYGTGAVLVQQESENPWHRGISTVKSDEPVVVVS